MAIADKGRAAESYLSYKAPLIVGELKERGDGGPAGQWKGELSRYPPSPRWGDVRTACGTSMDLCWRPAQTISGALRRLSTEFVSPE